LKAQQKSIAATSPGWVNAHKLPRLGAVILASLLLLLLLALPAGAQVVTRISITNIGPAAASEALVRANIRTKLGDRYNASAIDDDVRNLYATGFFRNIRVGQERVADGFELTYVLQGKPKLVDIIFAGNTKFSNKKIKNKIRSQVNEPLDDRKIFMDEQDIKKLYQESGYPQTQVQSVQSIDEVLGQARVTFQIMEAPKVRIIDVQFEGAGAFTQKQLRKEIKTRRWWMFSWITGSGTLKEDKLDEDKEHLADFYRNAGYIDFELRDVKFDYQTARRMVVTFKISEGRQYRVGANEFKGFAIFTTNQIEKSLKMKVGAIFTPTGLQTNIELIQDLYGTKGYIDAMILARKNPNPQTGTMDLVYEVEEHEKSYIEKIEIRGNTKTKDKVIRRELAVSPGEVFDMTRVKVSKQRLQGTQFFDQIDTQPEPTDVPDRKNLVITVEEGQTGHMQFGAGFSSIDSLLGYVEYREGNFQLPWFRGGGQKLRVRATLGSQRREYEMDFVEPWFLDKKLEFSLSAYHRELDYLSADDLYNLRRTGMRVGLRRGFTDNFIGGISYTIENVGIMDVSTNAPMTIQREKGDRIVSKIGPTLSYDTRRYSMEYAGMIPVSGQLTEFRTELAGGPFGGDTDYYKFELGTAWYFKGPFHGHILEVGGRAGTMDNYGSSTNVPFFDRFFLGGLDTLRGYRYRQVGPYEYGYDGTSERVGGKTYWFASAEYSVPIVQFLRFAVFYDIGMVYPDAFSFTQTQNTRFYNDNYGAGLRINIPQIGPLRLDYGIPITSDLINESSGRFQFSVGYTRDF
jgi:outer membrane protein insertion porin family